MPKDKREYQRGYAAARTFGEKQAAGLRGEIRALEQREHDEREERVFLACLDMTLKHCRTWEIGGERVKNAEGYCKLARIFMKESITQIGR